MDVDTTNQSTPPVSTTRPTATDPRLARVSNSFQNNPQAQKTPSPSTLSPRSGAPLPQNASKSPSTGLPPAPNGLHSAKGPEAAPTTDLERIVPSLSQLFDARATLIWRQHEKAVLEREDALLRRDLNRAKALPAVPFPATVDTLQSMKDRPPTGLQKLDADLTKQQAICSNMAEELRVILRDTCSSADEKTMKLEAELKEEWKAEFKEWKAECKEEWKAECKEEWKAECKEEWKAECKEEWKAECKEEWKAECKEEWKAECKEEWKAECKEEWKAEFKEAWKAEFKEELADAEKKLEAKIRSNMETEFKEKLFSTLMEQLRIEFKEKQAAPTTPDVESQDTMIGEFQEKLGRLENSVNFVSTSNRNLATQIARFDKWKRGIEEEQIRLPSQSEAPARPGHEVNLDLEKLKEQFPALENRVSQIEQQHSNWSALESKVNENTGTLHLLKSAREAAQNDEQGKVAALEAQIQQIQEQTIASSAKIASLETQPMPVNGEGSAKSYLSDRVSQLFQHVAAFKGIAEEMQKHRDAIRGHSVQINELQKSQEPMTVALRSLEQRYHNINSEVLVKSMANAMQEMYPGMQKVHEQLRSLHLQFNASKDETTKELHRLKGYTNNEDKASIGAALKDIKQFSEQFAQLQETQKSQAEDIVRHLEAVTELHNRLDPISVALAELGDKQSELSDLCDEIKALVPRVGEHDTHLENQAKQYTDLQESSQHLRIQLDTLMQSTSEDNIRRIAEDAQKEKLVAIAAQMEEFNLQCSSSLKKLENIQQQSFGSSDMNPESLQSLTNGLVPRSGIDGSSNTPQVTNSQSLTEKPQLLIAQPSPNIENSGDAPQVPKAPRALMPKPASSGPSPGAFGGSFRIKGAASQNGSGPQQNGSSSQSDPQKNAPDTPMGARVTTDPPSPTVTITQNRNATTGQDPPTASSAPNNGLPQKPPPQASAGKKRQRQATASDDESRDEKRANPILSNTAKPSPAPSSASDIPLRKKKKKEKRPQSPLK